MPLIQQSDKSKAALLKTAIGGGLGVFGSIMVAYPPFAAKVLGGGLKGIVGAAKLGTKAIWKSGPVGWAALAGIAGTGAILGIGRAATSLDTPDMSKSIGLTALGLGIGFLTSGRMRSGAWRAIKGGAKMWTKISTTPGGAYGLLAGGAAIGATAGLLTTERKLRANERPEDPRYKTLFGLHSSRMRPPPSQQELTNSIYGQNYNRSVGSMYADPSLTNNLVQSLHDMR